MRRAILLIIVSIGVVAATIAERPPPPPEPLADFIIGRPGLESPDDAAIWYCPWAQANAGRDSLIAVASIEETTASLTFPVVIPGEPSDEASIPLIGPGGGAVELSSVAVRGDSPSFIEFTDGPAAASVTVSGADVLAAGSCVSDGPDVWHFPGGSTRDRERLLLRLFNPFSESAKVTVTAQSDIGSEALGELRSISVPSRSWRDIEFENLLRRRQDLAVSVSTEQGLIIPVMAMSVPGDEAWWPGVGAGEVWDFPAAVRRDVVAEIAVVNPGLSPVTVTLDLYTSEGGMPGAMTATVEPDQPVRLVLPAFDGVAVGARLVSTGPVAAAVVARGEENLAITPGAPVAAKRWLLPGLRRNGLDRGSVSVLNTGDQVISVTISPLTGGPLTGERVLVAAQTVLEYPAADEALGYMVEGSDPISVAWTVAGPDGLAYATGIPADDG